MSENEGRSRSTVGPFHVNEGPESRQKDTSLSPTRAITSRLPGLPKLLWIRDTTSMLPKF